MKILENNNTKRLLSAIAVANMEHTAKLASLYADLITQEFAYSKEGQLIVEAVEAAKTQTQRIRRIMEGPGIAAPEAAPGKGVRNG